MFGYEFVCFFSVVKLWDFMVICLYVYFMWDIYSFYWRLFFVSGVVIVGFYIVKFILIKCDDGKWDYKFSFFRKIIVGFKIVYLSCDLFVYYKFLSLMWREYLIL